MQYLGHVITRSGLGPNARLTEVILNFPTPDDVGAVRRFLGLALHFIPRYFMDSPPRIHPLTAHPNARLFSPLPPVLAYPSFKNEFTLETDALLLGLGAVLSQQQEYSTLHPITYALNMCEKNYSITELKMLAMVCAITHFQSQLYGNTVKLKGKSLGSTGSSWDLNTGPSGYCPGILTTGILGPNPSLILMFSNDMALPL